MRVWVDEDVIVRLNMDKPAYLVFERECQVVGKLYLCSDGSDGGRIFDGNVGESARVFQEWIEGINRASLVTGKSESDLTTTQAPQGSIPVKEQQLSREQIVTHWQPSPSPSEVGEKKVKEDRTHEGLTYVEEETYAKSRSLQDHIAGVGALTQLICDTLGIPRRPVEDTDVELDRSDLAKQLMQCQARLLYVQAVLMDIHEAVLELQKIIGGSKD